jgi:hypothetical protein
MTQGFAFPSPRSNQVRWIFDAYWVCLGDWPFLETWVRTFSGNRGGWQIP